MENTPLQISQASATGLNAHDAVAQLKKRLTLAQPNFIIIFCSADFDMRVLGAELNQAWSCPIIGCTSAGQIDNTGYSTSTLSALAVAGPIRVTAHPINLSDIPQGVARIADSLATAPKLDDTLDRFGLLLIDGLQRKEEKLASMLYQELPVLPFVGGSAGDDMKLQHTFVYYKGQFLQNSAVFCIFETSLPFTLIKFEHYEPTDTQLIVTEADPERRIIYEFNGEAAAEVYARTIGKTVQALQNNDFITHPLLFPLGTENFVRDIQSVNPDGSLSLFCAIETGIVISIGQSVTPLQKAENIFNAITAKIGSPSFILGCDCAHRKLDFTNRRLLSQAGNLYAKNNVFGFNTYGEQYNGLHINQTFTGIALGQ